MLQSATISGIMNAWIAGAADAFISSLFPSLINTVLYGCSIVTSIYKWKQLKHLKSPIRERFFWLFVIFVLFVLGANKLLDFQVLLTEVGRRIAQYKGWFEYIRLVQAWFAYIISSIIGAAALLMFLLIRKLWRCNASALMGLFILCVYTVIRTTSSYHVGFDANPSRWGFRLTDMIEFLGISLIFINAVTYRKRE
jgi:hypothetical protein